MKLVAKVAGLTTSFLLFAGTALGATYTVQPGDTLGNIAGKHKTTVVDLMKMNQLNSYMIYPDQILKVSGSPTNYTVQSVDSMWSISQKFNVDLEVLKKANPQIKNFNNIWSGLKVFIPDNVNSNTTKAAKPDKFVDGLFPIVKGTYKTPVLNNYSDNRTWTPFW